MPSLGLHGEYCFVPKYVPYFAQKLMPWQVQRRPKFIYAVGLRGAERLADVVCGGFGGVQD
jgi:hypothetical protein